VIGHLSQRLTPPYKGKRDLIRRWFHHQAHIPVQQGAGRAPVGLVVVHDPVPFMVFRVRGCDVLLASLKPLICKSALLVGTTAGSQSVMRFLDLIQGYEWWVGDSVRGWFVRLLPAIHRFARQFILTQHTDLITAFDKKYDKDSLPNRMFVNMYDAGMVLGMGQHQDNTPFCSVFVMLTTDDSAATALQLQHLKPRIMEPGDVYVWRRCYHSVPAVARQCDRLTLNVFF